MDVHMYALCIVLYQFSWLGRITHTEQGRALCVLERTLPTELLRQLSWLGRITHTELGRALCVLERTKLNKPDSYKGDR